MDIWIGLPNSAGMGFLGSDGYGGEVDWFASNSTGLSTSLRSVTGVGCGVGGRAKELPGGIAMVAVVYCTL
ncbi:hypothetical protein SODALDRAFT_332994 [Sodiomyces alkalinus F11]|uniref:Uncharacterized protein n=1 Tax=Sodiomyces alkalinus (strain CBS 110278 / VKM F-3762 / F11) TaxID=1314773 RepID=A0A3N2PVB8_SODAK|nr:hypothetical protein SODALDRAFT_332994 [Sodiomyces alkalinus F11]ROT38424.1 hypothetical protein SODALDRAFT_332994 [Sodiomyces alkalinus F11]